MEDWGPTREEVFIKKVRVGSAKISLWLDFLMVFVVTPFLIWNIVDLSTKFNWSGVFCIGFLSYSCWISFKSLVRDIKKIKKMKKEGKEFCNVCKGNLYVTHITKMTDVEGKMVETKRFKEICPKCKGRGKLDWLQKVITPEG